MNSAQLDRIVYIMENVSENTKNIMRILSILYDIRKKSNSSKLNLVSRTINRIFYDNIPQQNNLNLKIIQQHTDEICVDSPKCPICHIKNYCFKYRFDEKSKYESRLYNNPSFVDLFCGSGGMSLGFEKAGFTPQFALDIDIHSIATFKFNHPSIPENRIVCSDIREIIKKINAAENPLKKIIKKRPSVVIGGPPCQGFSEANRQRLIEDSRNELYKFFVESIEFLKPKIFVMENVRGISKISNQILEDFTRVGYAVRMITLNSSDFGNPQERIRVFFVGIKSTENLLIDYSLIDEIIRNIENSKNGSKYVLKDAICGLRKIQARNEKGRSKIENEKSGYTIDKLFKCDNEDYLRLINNGKLPLIVYNHKARFNNKRDIEIFSRLPQGGKSDHPSIQIIMPYKNRSHIFKDKYFRLIADRPSKTITSHMRFDCNMYIHPFQARGLTPREAARVQGFPDEYAFQGPPNSWYKQIGNAVPPVVAYRIAKAILNSKVG